MAIWIESKLVIGYRNSFSANAIISFTGKSTKINVFVCQHYDSSINFDNIYRFWGGGITVDNIIDDR